MNTIAREMTTAQKMSARRAALEICVRDFLLDREDIALIRAANALLDGIAYGGPKMMLLPYPEFREVRMKVWKQAHTRDVKIMFAVEDVQSALRELSRNERPEIERLGGHSD